MLLTIPLNFYLFSLTTYLSKRASAAMSLFIFQLSSLVQKNIVVFDRAFFVELLFKRWLIVSSVIIIFFSFFI